MDDKELQQEFINFVAAKSGAKTEAELNKYMKSLTKEQQAQLRDEFVKYMQEKKTKSAQKAAKGAKLNYIKQLSHKCADDEELYYFKRGGSVGCGCKKKDGVVKAQNGEKTDSIVSKFKNKKKEEHGYFINPKTGKKTNPTPLNKQQAQKRAEESANDYNKGKSDIQKNKGINRNCKGSKIKINLG